MPPKKAKKLKGEPKKAPVTGGLVNRMPEDGFIEANELPQRPELLHGPEMSDPGIAQSCPPGTKINGGPASGIRQLEPRMGEGDGVNPT